MTTQVTHREAFYLDLDTILYCPNCEVGCALEECRPAPGLVVHCPWCFEPVEPVDEPVIVERPRA